MCMNHFENEYYKNGKYREKAFELLIESRHNDEKILFRKKRRNNGGEGCYDYHGY